MEETFPVEEASPDLVPSDLSSLINELRVHASSAGISITDAQVSMMARLCELLLEWNSRFNLSAIREPREIVYKHLLDSLAPAYTQWIAVGGVQPGNLLDVGSGAGFPALPLAIAFPETKVTALESSRKKSEFISLAACDLGLDVRVVRARAEAQGHRPTFREHFDVVVARAVAYLPALAEYCLPFVRIGGHFVALKSERLDEEIADGVGAVEVLGGILKEPRSYYLPGIQGQRWVLAAEKTSHTPEEYPRQPGIPTRKPLRS